MTRATNIRLKRGKVTSEASRADSIIAPDFDMAPYAAITIDTIVTVKVMMSTPKAMFAITVEPALEDFLHSGKGISEGVPRHKTHHHRQLTR